MLHSYQKPLKGNVGVVFGSFAPLHQGHLDLIMRAKKENSGGAIVIVCGFDGDKGEPMMPHEKRYRYVREFFADDDLVAVYAINDTELGLDKYPNGWIGWMKEFENIYEKAVVDKSCERTWYVGDEIYLRGLIEFSNICKNNCCYCGIRKDNHNLQRYRFTEEQILTMAKKAKSCGMQTVVLQSGEDLWFDTERMCSIISKIKELDLAITLSIGEKSYDEYKAYRQAGADRYLLRIETTDKDLYHKLDPDMSWDNRKRCLDDLKDLGYEVGSGTMVGLPEQSLLSIAQDIAFFKEIDLDMAGIGPFIPHPDTPLRDAKGKAFTLSLKVMALTRLLLPSITSFGAIGFLHSFMILPKRRLHTK